jgi:hypothetical protein
MAAVKGDAEKGIRLRDAGGMEADLGVVALPGFRRKSGRMSRAGACRLVRALFGDGRKAFLIAGIPAHHAHRAMVLAVAAAAGGETGLGVRGKEGRNQHPTEDHQQRDCDCAAHRQSNKCNSEYRFSGFLAKLMKQTTKSIDFWRFRRGEISPVNLSVLQGISFISNFGE